MEPMICKKDMGCRREGNGDEQDDEQDLHIHDDLPAAAFMLTALTVSGEGRVKGYSSVLVLDGGRLFSVSDVLTSFFSAAGFSAAGAFFPP